MHELLAEECCLPGRGPGGRYTRGEEIANAVTHGLGAALAVAGLAVLVVLGSLYGQAWHIVSFSIYGAGLVLVYFVSTAYHCCPPGRTRRVMRVLDHCAIYVLIAGTYTPFLLIPLRGGWGWSLFGVLWGLSAVGMVYKAVWGHRFEWLSRTLYLAMGWIAVVAVKPMLAHLPPGCLAWLLAGGLLYTAGVLFYAWEKLLFHHAIWHGFVLGGSICHYIAVVAYVAPGA